MKRSYSLAVVLISTVLTFGTLQEGYAHVSPDPLNVDQTLRDLPTGERWLRHLRDDLLPFWTTESALGTDGNFPTYRCNDGSTVDLSDVCNELKNPVPGIVWLDREHVRAKSRQIYAYGVGFHMTGDLRLLEHAKRGVSYLRAHAIDRLKGGAYSYWQRDSHGAWIPGPESPQRTSQDLAYAIAGMAFYYYLTRDEDVLQDILMVKNYIFKTYYDSEWELLAWVREKSADCVGQAQGCDDPSQRELVAQLDQIYAYMLLLAPILPDPHRQEWLGQLERTAKSIIEQFYAPGMNVVWGAITDPSYKRLGQRHVDFGHTVKSLWLIYQVGKLTRNETFVTFGAQTVAQVLKQAFLQDGTWGRRLHENGRIDIDKEWWIMAELDQAAAILALLDPAYARYLPSTYSSSIRRYLLKSYLRKEAFLTLGMYR